MKNPHKVAQGTKSRKQGKAFELKVRHDLEDKGWIVTKWQNDVQFGAGSVLVDTATMDSNKGILGTAMCNSGKIIPAKHQFNPFTKAMSAGNGFPDFVCFKKADCHLDGFVAERFIIQFVESKMTGKLSKVEKEKLEWLELNTKIPCYISKKGEKRGAIIYESFKERYQNKGRKTERQEAK